MISPFMFVILCSPSDNNRFYGKIAQGYFHVWVMSESDDQALSRALDYISRQHWNPIEVQHAFVIDEKHLPDLHKDEVALYRQARIHGIAGDIIASLVDEGNAGDPAILAPPY